MINTEIKNTSLKNLGGKFRERIEELNREDIIFILLSAALTIFLLYKYNNETYVMNRATISSFISLLIQILSSVFAIIITISLVAIQLTAQNYSSKLIKIYTNSFHFKFLIVMFITAIVLNIFILFYIEEVSDALINISILFSLISIIELFPFIFSITRNLDPKTVIEHLIKDLRRYKILSGTNNLESYDSLFQPIEDIVTRSITSFDYQTAKYGIKLFIENFNSLIKTKDFEIQIETNGNTLDYLQPYFDLIWNVSNNAKKSDAIELIKYIFSMIFNVINELPDNRYLPVYDKLIEIIENVRYQAETRFDNKEYILELAEMKLLVADSLSEFSQKTI